MTRRFPRIWPCIALLGVAWGSYGVNAPCRGDVVQEALPPLVTSVGEYGRIRDRILPGPALQAKAIREEHPKLVLRVAAIHPHGTNHRYDLEYYGMEPGHYDLRQYLERTDGGPVGDLPEMPVIVRSLLPPGQILPNSLATSAAPRLGGYTVLMTSAAILWVLALLAILFGFRRVNESAEASESRRTLADYLMPRLTAARKGTLPPRELAELERWIVEAWRRRRGMQALAPGEALQRLRHDTIAGPPLRQLEQWLHEPEATHRPPLAEVLRPYDDWPLEFEMTPADQRDPPPANGARR